MHSGIKYRQKGQIGLFHSKAQLFPILSLIKTYESNPELIKQETKETQVNRHYSLCFVYFGFDDT